MAPLVPKHVGVANLSWIVYLLTSFLTYLLTYLLTHSLTPCSRVLLDKLTVSQLLKKFPAFYGTRRFITAVTSASDLSLSWASSIQSIPPHPNSWRYILILSSHLCLVPRVVSFPQVSPSKPCIRLSSPHTLYMPSPSHCILLSTDVGWCINYKNIHVMNNTDMCWFK